MYAYIQGGILAMTSPQIIKKQVEEISEEVEKERKLKGTRLNEAGEEEEYEEVEEYKERVVTQAFESGMVFDEMIEYTNKGRVCYEGGKIIDWEKSQEKKKEDDAQIAYVEKVKADRIEKIVQEIGVLGNKKTGLEILGENTDEVEAQIAALRKEYGELKDTINS